jgi:GT2 family glycosyltransferase
VTAERPAVTVVFVTYESRLRIRRFMAPLVEAVQTAGVPASFLAIDNASSDGTPEEIERYVPAVTVLRSGENLGFAGGCNLGARGTDAPWLWFCNDDLVMTPEAAAALWAAREPTDCLVPLVRGVDGRLQNAIRASWRLGDLKLDAQPDPLPFVAYPMGACLLLHRDLFARAGGFDERFDPAYYEDAALGLAIWRAGGRVRMVHQATAVHHNQGGAPTTVHRERISDLVLEHRWVFAATNLHGWRRLVALLLGAPRTVAESWRWRSARPLRGYAHALRRVPALVRTTPRPSMSDGALLARISTAR